MDRINIVIPFRYIEVGMSDFAKHTLSQYRLTATFLATICTDFIGEFAYTSTEGLVMPEPLVLANFVRNEFHQSTVDYVKEVSLYVPLENKVSNQMVLQIVADVVYVMCYEMIQVLTNHIQHSRYPVEQISFHVLGATYENVQVELRHEPCILRRGYKFCHYTPTVPQTGIIGDLGEI